MWQLQMNYDLLESILKYIFIIIFCKKVNYALNGVLLLLNIPNSLEQNACVISL